MSYILPLYFAECLTIISDQGPYIKRKIGLMSGRLSNPDYIVYEIGDFHVIFEYSFQCANLLFTIMSFG